MGEKTFSKYIFTTAEKMTPEEIKEAACVPMIQTKDHDLLGFAVDSCWYRKPYVINEDIYAVPFDEIYVFVGSDLDNIVNLGGKVSFTIGEKDYSCEKSCIVFFPKYVPHGKIRVERVDRPIFSYRSALCRELVPLDKELWQDAPDEPEKFFIETADDVTTSHWETDEHTKDILWNCSEGFGGSSVYHNIRYFVPYKEPYKWAADPHGHPMAEVISFFGCDPDNPYELGADITVDMDKETCPIKEASVVYAPPYFPHCPLMINKVEKPYFFFACAPDFPEYITFYFEKKE